MSTPRNPDFVVFTCEHCGQAIRKGVISGRWFLRSCGPAIAADYICRARTDDRTNHEPSGENA